MANTGKDYELFVANLQQALLGAERITTQANIVVEVDKKIIDNCGIERQFDIYWEYDLGGFTYKTVIECKDYASTVSVDKIDSLIGKIVDIPDLKAVFATKKGYQSGAKAKAQKHKVDLLIVREQNETDWTDENGNPLIKEVSINIELVMPSEIKSFSPEIDGDWVAKETNIDLALLKNTSILSDTIYIEDVSAGAKYSLYDLSSKLMPLDGKEYGNFESTVKCENAFLHHNNTILKLRGYKVEYSISKPINNLIVVDFTKELVGVVEYLQKGTKKSIFKDGVIR